MNKLAWIAVFYICVLFAKTTQAITQEIRYSAADASEVYIVWGINNWQLPENKNIPKGSYIKDNLIYTSMVKDEEKFSVNIEAPPGAVIDYVFWIRKGLYDKQADVWDTNAPNQKDYHTYVTDNTIALVESKIKVRPKEPLSILDFAYMFLAASTIAYCIIYCIQKFWIKRTLEKHPSLIIICSALSLFIGLFLIRPSVMGISWELFTNPLTYTIPAFWAVFYDFVYICILTLLFLLPLLVLKHPKIQKAICYCFIALCCFSLIIGVFNIRIVDMLGKPFNYQWLYYSNFLKGADAQAAIAANFSYSYALRIISICISAFLIGLIAFKGIGLLRYNPGRRRIALVICMLTILIYSVTAHKKLQAQQWDYDRLANPVAAFIESVNPFATNPDLFTMPVSDKLKFKKELGPMNMQPTLKDSKIKNVIVFVMESTPAEYIETYGSKYPVSPNIKKYEKQSITFENIYAHAPATNMSMVSLLGSVYPWLSFNSLTEEHPDLKIPSISAELKQRGFRTAFFNSADNRYQKADEFLSYRKFDIIKDCNENSCGNDKFEYTDEKKNFLNGKDDACTGKELTDWIIQDTSKRFFCVMWTYQTHYPYFYKGQATNYEPNDSVFNRYLNALQYGDSVLGKLLEDLDKKRLSESTLVIVVGDHGEAFGRHNQTTHGREVYEENMHVPCILINPLLKEERKKEIGGIVDIAPTIMNVLGYESPTQWQGESLFSKTTSSRTYFFAPWSDYLFGYREGNYKYIYNATKNETEIYNLKDDPYEERNLVNEKVNEVEIAHQRMAAWAQYVNDATAKLLKQ